jgi:hypothetical protein
MLMLKTIQHSALKHYILQRLNPDVHHFNVLSLYAFIISDNSKTIMEIPHYVVDVAYFSKKSLLTGLWAKICIRLAGSGISAY